MLVDALPDTNGVGDQQFTFNCCNKVATYTG